MDKINGALNNCGKKVEEATKHAESMVDNIWNHGEFSSFCPITASIYIIDKNYIVKNLSHIYIYIYN